MKLFIVYTPGVFDIPDSRIAFLTARDAQEDVERRNREQDAFLGRRWYWRSVVIGEDFVTGVQYKLTP